jgi:FtsP/CotA-like multicopper oxidase with cupredoxin domain
MPGTFFYHPHKHGSSALQFGGGASGLLIVEDEPNSLPPQVLGMEDNALVLTFIETPRMTELQERFNFALWQVTQQTSMLLTNGQTSPSKIVFAGAWYRLRLLFTSDQSIATLSMQTASGTSTCEMQLLAKDGIVLTAAPRLINKAYIPAGGRAEVAVRCTNDGRVSLMAELVPAGTIKVSTFVALDLIVQASTTREADISPFRAFRPCYLVDTSTVSPATALDLTQGTGNPNTKLNDQFFISPDVSLNPDSPFIVGTVGQITLIQGTFVHVLHIHVNPFQITQLSPVIDTNYFQVGDWHDTFNVYTAQPPGSDKTVIRFWVDRYAGHAVIHCHMSTHEDAGMMNTYLITGVEGATVDTAAQTIDGTCYTDVSGQGYS